MPKKLNRFDRAERFSFKCLIINSSLDIFLLLFFFASFRNVTEAICRLWVFVFIFFSDFALNNCVKFKVNF